MSKSLEITIGTDRMQQFKILIKMLSKIMIDVNIICCSVFKKYDDCNGYMEINEVDPSKSILINLKLYAKSFTTFYCPERKVLGVNLPQFNEIIETVDENEWITFYIDDEEQTKLNIHVHNHDEQKVKIFTLKLFNIVETVCFLKSEPDLKIIMGINEMHKTCKKMLCTGEFVKFKCLKNSFIMKCAGDSSDTIICYESKDYNVKIIKAGSFQLKHLMLLTEYSELCPDIEIHVKNDFPVGIKYNLSCGGSLLVYLSPEDIEKKYCQTEIKTKLINYCVLNDLIQINYE